VKEFSTKNNFCVFLTQADDLGRVVIPKEIRRTMRIREGDPLEIYTEKDGEVIFKKYSPVGELGDFATKYAEVLAKASGYGACITDYDVIIAVAGVSKKELMEKRLSNDVEDILSEKSIFVTDGNKKLEIAEGVDKYSVGAAAPIISDGDTIGSVIIFSGDNAKMGEVEGKLVESAAGFLGKYMEI